MELPSYKDIKLFAQKDIKIWQQQHHEQLLKATYRMQRMQEQGCWQHKGGTNLQAQNRSIDDEINFGDSGYEVTTRHEDHTKIENGTKKELHVLKQQFKEEHEAA